MARYVGFDQAYSYLAANSDLLIRTQEGNLEVWETNGQLMTVVDLRKREFWTKKRKHNPAQYDGGKRKLLEMMNRG